MVTESLVINAETVLHNVFSGIGGLGEFGEKFLFDLGLPSFDTIVHNSKAVFCLILGFLSAELTNKINALFRRLSDLVTRLATLQCQI